MLTPRKRGRKADPDKALVQENKRLVRENARLEQRLAQAEAITEIPKSLLDLGDPPESARRRGEQIVSAIVQARPIVPLAPLCTALVASLDSCWASWMGHSSSIIRRV